MERRRANRTALRDLEGTPRGRLSARKAKQMGDCTPFEPGRALRPWGFDSLAFRTRVSSTIGLLERAVTPWPLVCQVRLLGRASSPTKCGAPLSYRLSFLYASALPQGREGPPGPLLSFLPVPAA